MLTEQAVHGRVEVLFLPRGVGPEFVLEERDHAVQRPCFHRAGASPGGIHGCPQVGQVLR